MGRRARRGAGALPAAIGRFTACKLPRVPDKASRERRTRYLGQSAVTSALDAAARLERDDSAPLADRYFPELALAWRAVEKIRAAGRIDPALLDFDCIAVDECQDLTPIEAALLVDLASLVNGRRPLPVPVLLAAGR